MKKTNWITSNNDKIQGKEYFQEMAEEFPELAEELNDWDTDLVHLKMEVFSSYTNRQIKEGNDKELIRCFRFQEERLGKLDFQLENAIEVSFCETLLLENEDEVMEDKRKLMEKKLKQYYDEYKRHYLASTKKMKEK